MPAKLSEAELIRYRSSVYGVAATVGHVPRMHLGKLTTCIPCFQAVLLCAPPRARAGKLTALHARRRAMQPKDHCISSGIIALLSPIDKWRPPVPQCGAEGQVSYHLVSCLQAGTGGMSRRMLPAQCLLWPSPLRLPKWPAARTRQV